MTDEQKPRVPQSVPLPALPLPNTKDESIAAGLEYRRSAEEMEEDLRSHAKKVSRNLIEFAASLVPRLQVYRRLVNEGRENDVKVYLSLVGCPPGESRPHPTAAARDPLAYMIARCRTHPNECGEIISKMNSQISKVAAVAAHLANTGVASAEEARAIIK